MEIYVAGHRAGSGAEQQAGQAGDPPQGWEMLFRNEDISQTRGTFVQSTWYCLIGSYEVW